MQSQVAPFQRSFDASNSGGLSGQAAPVGLGGPLHIRPRNGLAEALPESDDVSVRDDITCSDVRMKARTRTRRWVAAMVRGIFDSAELG